MIIGGGGICQGSYGQEKSGKQLRFKGSQEVSGNFVET